MNAKIFLLNEEKQNLDQRGYYKNPKRNLRTIKKKMKQNDLICTKACKNLGTYGNHGIAEYITNILNSIYENITKINQNPNNTFLKQAKGVVEINIYGIIEISPEKKSHQ